MHICCTTEFASLTGSSDLFKCTSFCVHYSSPQFCLLQCRCYCFFMIAHQSCPWFCSAAISPFVLLLLLVDDSAAAVVVAVVTMLLLLLSTAVPPRCPGQHIRMRGSPAAAAAAAAAKIDNQQSNFSLVFLYTVYFADITGGGQCFVFQCDNTREGL